MSEKTEQPTTRKLKKARAEGDVPYSNDLTFALMFFVFLTMLWILSSSLERGFRNIFDISYSYCNTDGPLHTFYEVFHPLFYPIFWLMIIIFFIVLILHFLQKGWIWSWPKSQAKTPFRWFFVFFKLFLLSTVTYWFMKKEIRAYQPALLLSLTGQVAFVYKKLFSFLLILSVVLLLIGIFDFFYQKWRYAKRMRMTQQEIKEEKRETDNSHRTY